MAVCSRCASGGDNRNRDQYMGNQGLGNAKLTTHLVTFSDESMSRSRERCVRSSIANGVNYPVAAEWSVVKNAPEYFRLASMLAAAPRGPAYWSWKPLLIDAALAHLRDGDILIYADAGIEFINNVNYIIDRMDQDIFLFGNNWEHYAWCKRDVIEKVWPLDLEQLRADPRSDDESLTFGEWWQDRGWKRFGKQVQASVIFFCVSDYTRKFVKEWLDWCLFEGGRLIDDSPSRTPNHPEFREHRHDQAILTTMAYREGIKLHYWPAQYNDGAFSYEKLPEYASDDYPILFNHHRKRNHEWAKCA